MSKGTDILNMARSCIGKKYGSYYNGHRMDCSGLVRYCLTKLCSVSGSALGGGCKQQWEYFTGRHHKGTVLYQASSMLGKGKNISTSKVKAGDLLYKFNYDNSGNHHVMIANGKGGTVDASGGAGQVREKQPYSWAYKEVGLWVRMDEDGSSNATTTTNLSNETSKPSTSTKSSTSNLSSGNVQDSASSSPVVAATTDEEGDPEGDEGSSSANVSSTTQYDYSYVLAGGLPLTSVDTYKGAMTKILSEISSKKNLVFNGATLKGHALGYLYDLTNGGSFKFILPEFSESYQANYDAITIPGRSSDVQSYSSTSSPSRTVSLQLMAGEGLYNYGASSEDALLNDIAFLKSLCYPDYQSSIVKPPPIVLLYLGPSSVLKGVVTTCTVNGKKPYTVDGKPMYFEVSFTVVQATDNPPDYKDIRNKSSVAY